MKINKFFVRYVQYVTWPRNHTKRVLFFIRTYIHTYVQLVTPLLLYTPAAHTHPPPPLLDRYGGYALSFTLALGLGANVSSTYLMVAGGYLLLLAGAVGAWAASSIRPDAFRIHFGALLPAGVLYFSLTIVQLARVGPSNRHVKEAWASLHAGGDDLYITQAKVRTTLIVGGVLSAATFALIVAAAVASWAARRALLRLPGGGGGGGAGAGGWKGRPRLSRGEVLAATWALALAATSTFFDGSFAVFSAWLARDREQAVWLVAFWRAMGRGDRRYVEGDTFVVATAIIVAAVIGPGALLYAWSVYCRKGFRFSVGILVCAASLHTQLLRYVTSAGNDSEDNSESVSGSDSGSGSGGKAFFIAASVLLALLQVGGALAVLMYNIRRMTKRVHAAEVQYRALLLEHDRLSLKGAAATTAAAAADGSSSAGGTGSSGNGSSGSGSIGGGGGGGPGLRGLEEEEEERVVCYPPLERETDRGAPGRGGNHPRLRLRR